MTTQERIAKLEALLTRVRARAAEPRPMKVIDAAMSVRSPLASSVVAPTVAEPEPPPPSDVPPTPNVAAPAPAPRREESIERIKAAEPATVEEPLAADSAPQLEVAEVVTEEAEAIEIEEPEAAPLSSRRPVAAEVEPEKNLAELAFGEELPPPRHTPPPESGKLPAAPELDTFDADVTGVREAPKVAHDTGRPTMLGGDEVPSQALPSHREPTPAPAPVQEHTEPLPIPAAAAPRPSHVEPKELSPEVVRPHIEPSAPAADFVGDAQRFKPATFGELLDATLSL